MPFFFQAKDSNLVHTFSLYMVLLGVVLSVYLSEFLVNGSNAELAYLGSFTVIQYSYMTCFMLLAWWSAPKSKTLNDVRLLLIIAILVRVILIPIEPYTSNDVDRYLFDGKIALSGYDPYQTNHNALEFEELKAQWSPPEEHTQYSTLYPPLSLALFSLAAVAGPEKAYLVWKLMVGLAGILTVFILALMLKKMGRLRHLSLVGLSPLLILETGIGGHVDAISTLIVSFALYFFYLKRLLLTGVFIALGVLIKILPLMLMVPLFFGLKKLTEGFRLVGAFVITVVLGYGITFVIGLVPVGSISIFFEKWRFGSPLFSLLELFLEGQLLLWAVLITFLGGGIALAYRSWKQSFDMYVDNPLLPWSIALVLLISPVVFPWYLMVLVPLLAIAPRPFILTWICCVPLTYEVLGGFVSRGLWQPSVWPLIIIAVGWGVSSYFEYRFFFNRYSNTTRMVN